MRKKIIIILMMAMLVGVVAGSQMLGERLYAQVDESAENEEADHPAGEETPEETDHPAGEETPEETDHPAGEKTLEEADSLAGEGPSEEADHPAGEKTLEEADSLAGEGTSEAADHPAGERNTEEEIPDEGTNENIETIGNAENQEPAKTEKQKSENKNQENGNKKAEGALVVLDAGHGGFDPGKIGINGALEKDVNLIVTQKVKKYLEDMGARVIMTRENGGELADSKVEDLKARVTSINENAPSIAVSIHQNSYSQESIHGAQVFYYTHSKTGEQAAKILQEAMLEVDPDNTRQAKANDTYYLLKKTKETTVIVECGFLSNQREADLLISDEYQEKMAAAIAKGIQEYLSSFTL